MTDVCNALSKYFQITWDLCFMLVIEYIGFFCLIFSNIFLCFSVLFPSIFISQFLIIIWYLDAELEMINDWVIKWFSSKGIQIHPMILRSFYLKIWKYGHPTGIWCFNFGLQLVYVNFNFLLINPTCQLLYSAVNY